MIICPECKGKKYIMSPDLIEITNPLTKHKCDVCKGKGYMNSQDSRKLNKYYKILWILFFSGCIILSTLILIAIKSG